MPIHRHDRNVGLGIAAAFDDCRILHGAVAIDEQVEGGGDIVCQQTHPHVQIGGGHLDEVLAFRVITWSFTPDRGAIGDADGGGRCGEWVAGRVDAGARAEQEGKGEEGWKDSFQDRDRGWVVPCSDYLVKPFTVFELPGLLDCGEPRVSIMPLL